MNGQDNVSDTQVYHICGKFSRENYLDEPWDTELRRAIIKFIKEFTKFKENMSKHLNKFKENKTVRMTSEKTQAYS